MILEILKTFIFIQIIYNQMSLLLSHFKSLKIHPVRPARKDAKETEQYTVMPLSCVSLDFRDR